MQNPASGLRRILLPRRWVNNTLEAVGLVGHLLTLFSLLLPPAGARGGEMIARALHVMELFAGIVGVWIGLWRLPDAVSALGVVTPTALGLVGLLAFLRHFVFHHSDAQRLGWESAKPQFQYEVGFANLAFALVAFLAYLGRWSVGAQVVVVLSYGLYLLQAALLHTWESVRGGGHRRRLLQNALPALAYSLLMIYLAIRGMIEADLPPSNPAKVSQARSEGGGLATRTSENPCFTHSGE